MNANIKLTYLYRDAGNNKLWNEHELTNKLDISLDLIIKTVLSNLIDSQFFIPERWNLPRLSFENFDPELNHSYHEFHKTELTGASNTPDQDIAELLLTIVRDS